MGENQPKQPKNPMGQNKGLCWGISKMWDEMSDVNSFIDSYSLDYDGAISMKLCDSKRPYFSPSNLR